MSSEIHIGDVVQFESTIKDQDDVVVDISSATTKQFLFQTPNGSLITKDAEFLTDGTDGVLVYRTINTDLNQSGSWRYQIYVVYDSNENHSDITKFKVLANLPLT